MADRRGRSADRRRQLPGKLDRATARRGGGSTRPARGQPPCGRPWAADGSLARIDTAIATWSGNLARDDADFVAAIQLGELYLARTRLTSDPADVARALAAADAALIAAPDLPAARLLRTHAHLANHDFAAAVTDAEAVLAGQPDAPMALAALGDATLELGEYDAAERAYDALADAAAGPAVQARLARLAAATGDLAGARRLADAALAAANRDPDTASETLAWYHTLSGALAFQAGDVAGSSDAYASAFEAWPGSAAALAGLARATAAAGDLAGAIPLYERAIAILPRPETLAALGDLLELTGDTTAAEEQRAMALAVGGLAPDRQLAKYLADHGVDPDRAVELARRDLQSRHDAYAHDTLAWALLANGMPQEADAAMRIARSHGTEDALLDYHAGMIAAALGRDEEARDLLRSALERNAGFDPLQSVRAAEALAELEARP